MTAPLHRIILIWLIICVAQPAAAHVSERAIVLLLPTDYYSAFGVLAVMLTVVLTIVVPPGAFNAVFAPRRDREHAGMGGTSPVRQFAQAIGFLVFAGLIAIGLFGPRDPLSNLLPLTIFTVWWICLLILQATLGDIWRWINPWSAPVRWFFATRTAQPVPDWINAWPALLGFLLFAAYYLTDIAPDDPARLAVFAGSYWAFTLTMCGIFGREWLVRCEIFTVLFNLAAQLSLLPGHRPQIPGKKLVQFQNPGISLAVMSVTFLAVGSFDGLNETFWWFGKLGINPLEFAGRSSVVSQNLFGLIGSVVLLNLVFAGCVFAGHILTGQHQNFRQLYTRLALTLLPIGIGYHFAHYLTSVMIGLQYWIAAVDDPLQTGMHFLRLEDFHTTTGFLNQYSTVTTIWLTQAGAIVLGHMVAVILAHAIALEMYGDHKSAVLSQIFPALFMIAYTFFGLWLLASPTAL